MRDLVKKTNAAGAQFEENKTAFVDFLIAVDEQTAVLGDKEWQALAIRARVLRNKRITVPDRMTLQIFEAQWRGGFKPFEIHLRANPSSDAVQRVKKVKIVPADQKTCGCGTAADQDPLVGKVLVRRRISR
jgi:hypothetical protein